MNSLLGFIAFALLLTWAMRYAVRAELERAGIFRAERTLTHNEFQEVMAMVADGKFNASQSLHDRYRFDVKRPSDPANA